MLKDAKTDRAREQWNVNFIEYEVAFDRQVSINSPFQEFHSSKEVHSGPGDVTICISQLILVRLARVVYI